MDISNKKGDEVSLENRKYIRWDAEGVEEIQPNEEENIKTVVEQINTIQRAMYNQHRHAFGGKHILADTWYVLQPAKSSHRHTREDTWSRQGQAHCSGRPAQAFEADLI